MITLITKILAVIAVIMGFRISAKHWDGRQMITLIVNGFLAVVGGVLAIAYLIWKKIKN